MSALTIPGRLRTIADDIEVALRLPRDNPDLLRRRWTKIAKALGDAFSETVREAEGTACAGEAKKP